MMRCRLIPQRPAQAGAQPLSTDPCKLTASLSCSQQCITERSRNAVPRHMCDGTLESDEPPLDRCFWLAADQ